MLRTTESNGLMTKRLAHQPYALQLVILRRSSASSIPTPSLTSSASSALSSSSFWMPMSIISTEAESAATVTAGHEAVGCRPGAVGHATDTRVQAHVAGAPMRRAPHPPAACARWVAEDGLPQRAQQSEPISGCAPRRGGREGKGGSAAARALRGRGLQVPLSCSQGSDTKTAAWVSRRVFGAWRRREPCCSPWCRSQHAPSTQLQGSAVKVSTLS